MNRFNIGSLQDKKLIKMCYSKVVECLMNYGCNIEEQLSKDDLNRLLHIAVKKGLQSVVKALVKSGADVYYKDNIGNSALILAKKYKNDQIYNTLVHTEVVTNSHYGKNTTSLLKISVIFLLLESYYSNYFPTFYCTYQSICENPVDITMLLLNNSGIIKDFFYELYRAIEAGFEDIVYIIISTGVNINTNDKFGRLMLQCACFHGNKNAVQFLLNMGADVNKLDVYQRSPLYSAIAAQQVDIIKLLINKGADVNVHKCGRNLLYCAIDGEQEKGLEIIKILVKEGINVNCSVNKSLPLFHYAVERNCTDIVEYLLKSGTNVNHQNIQGETCLHISLITLTRKGDYDIKVDQYYNLFTLFLENKTNWIKRWQKRVKEKGKMSLVLLQNGADINVEDNRGNTPLMVNNIGTVGVILLVKHIAKLSIKNENISDTNIKFINNNQKLKDFLLKCEEELNLMKKELIYGNVSFYDILYELNLNQLAIYTKNESLEIILMNSDSEIAKFPIYDQELKIQFAKGKERRATLESASAVLNQYFHFLIPNILVEKILFSLSCEDWINIIKSYVPVSL